MKTRLISIFIIMAIAIMAVSCGSTKKITSSAHPDEQLVASDPCEVYALENPAKRGAGMGLHFQKSTARNVAEIQARAVLARSLQTCIETTTKEYADGATLFAADDKDGQSVTDQTASVNDRVASMSKELIKGAPVVKETIYRTKNNQYRVYVCVEYSESVPQMAAKIAKSFSEMITQEQKARIKFDELQFQKEQEKTFEDYKGVTMQQ